ncbi:hypothetical protein [Desulfosporosinus sp. Sb-LF]|nr:hypothetical protein [Desulfosporosinus sp. Sb-LF]
MSANAKPEERQRDLSKDGIANGQNSQGVLRFSRGVKRIAMERVRTC